MSYYARIYFKQVESMEEAIKVLNNFMKDYQGCIQYTIIKTKKETE